MAYDPDTVDRLRERLSQRPDVREQRMFGSLGFLVGGHLTVAASGQGGLLVRTDPADADDLADESAVTAVVMRGRPMPGWLRVGADAIESEAELDRWVARALAFVATLPPKS